MINPDEGSDFATGFASAVSGLNSASKGLVGIIWLRVRLQLNNSALGSGFESTVNLGLVAAIESHQSLCKNS